MIGTIRVELTVKEAGSFKTVVVRAAEVALQLPAADELFELFGTTIQVKGGYVE